MLILSYDNLAEPIRDADMEMTATGIINDYEDHVAAGFKSGYPVNFSNMLFFHVMRLHLKEREVSYKDVSILGSDNNTFYFFDDDTYLFSDWDKCFDRIKYNPELYYIKTLLE